MKTLRYLIFLLILGSLSASLSLSAEEEGWKTEKMKLVFFKSVKEALQYQSAAFRKNPMFFADDHWLDSDADKRYKNYEEEGIGPPTKSTKHNGVYVKRFKNAIEIDTNGDDVLDKRLSKSEIVKVKVRYPEKTITLPILFILDGGDTPHWSYTRGSYWTGKVAGQKVMFFDENMDGFLSILGDDGLAIGKEKYGSYMTTIILVKNKLYDLQAGEMGKSLKYRPYPGLATKVDYASKFKGPMKPKFVVLRTPDKDNRPNPYGVSIYLPKGVGLVPRGVYDFKWTMLSERCVGRNHTRHWQWIDDQKLPYIIEGKGKKTKKVVPPHQTTPLKIADNEKITIEWGAPFVIHMLPSHQTLDGGGAKCDNILLEIWNFVFYDSSGVCFFAPLEFENEGVAIPEELMFNVIAYSPNTGKQISRNTRYTKGGADGGTGWDSFAIPIKGERGTFKLEVTCKSKHFGVMHNFVDFTIPKDKK